MSEELIGQDNMARKEKEKTDPRREVWQWVQSIIVSIIIVVLLFTFVGRPLTVKGTSMVPTFQDGDKIISTNLLKDYKYGDIVVIKREKNKPLIKRVIAVGGDTVDIDFNSGNVYVNGELLTEPYINEPTTQNHGVQFPVTVPESCVFVMGDNRNHSDDSRNPQIGMIKEKQIFGKVVFRLYPFNRMGTVE